MASLLIRKIDDALHARLKDSAARRGRSLEQEARELLRVAVARENSGPAEPLGDLARRLFQPLGGVELELNPRERQPERPSPDFSTTDYDR